MHRTSDRHASAPNRNQPDRRPLDAGQVALARAMARLLRDTAVQADAQYEPGDLVLRHYLSGDQLGDLLVVYGDHDALDRVVAYIRTLGHEAGSWVEGNGPTDPHSA